MFKCSPERLIRSYVNFKHGVIAHGWNTTYCEVCGDGSRTKGPRGGFLFTDDGNTAFYHCFNCGANESVSIKREYPFSKGMRNVLDKFGVPPNEYNALLLTKSKTSAIAAPAFVHSYPTLSLPDNFVLLRDCNSDGAKLAKKFLRENYALSVNDYSFYFADGTNKSKMAGRLVIPFYKNGKIIYYQARRIQNGDKIKYMSPDISKNNILFNMDQLTRVTSEPLYITEGALDAIQLNGVATLGNEITSAQKSLLASSSRRKVLVPDFNGDSFKLCEQFITNGWDVAFPEYGKKYKDVSEAIINYGKLYTAYDIVSHSFNAERARIVAEFQRTMWRR